MVLKIGLVGCGAIGTEIARAIDSGDIAAELVAVFDRNEDRARELLRGLKAQPKLSDRRLLWRRPYRRAGLGYTITALEFDGVEVVWVRDSTAIVLQHGDGEGRPPVRPDHLRHRA